jgi:hypothetical protein
MFVYVNNFTLLRLWKEIPLTDSFRISLGYLLFPLHYTSLSFYSTILYIQRIFVITVK